MNNARSPRSVSAAETPPSNLCTECSPESCLEFTVVDYWGDPVSSPTKFEMDGKPVSPDTPIRPLKCGKHILKAVDGEKLCQEIFNLPYEPVWGAPFPAYLKARREHMAYQRAPETSIWEGVPLLTYSPTSSFTKGKCRKVLVEINQGIDYYVLMVFLDNHSGGLHGTGHAGVMIINGQTGKGLYTDFGPYYPIAVERRRYRPYGELLIEKITEKVGEVRTEQIATMLLHTKNGTFNEEVMGDIFRDINTSYGSGIQSKNNCILKNFLNGPDHEDFHADIPYLDQVHRRLRNIAYPIDPFSLFLPSGFCINGLVAWAAYVLPGGAYEHMKKYIDEEKQRMIQLQKQNKNGYSGAKFNCMTYSLAILDKGLGLDRPPGKQGDFDHPNDHIQAHMMKAQDCGIFDNRLFSGLPEAVNQTKQSPVPGIRHHDKLHWAFSMEILHAKH